MEMLIVQRMSQFVRHHHSYVGMRIPVGDKKFLAVRVVQSRNLLGKHFYERLFQRIIFRKQTKLLHAFLIGVPFGGVLVFIHFLQKVSLNVIPGTKTFFEGRKNRKGKQFAHFGEHFVSRLQELGALLGRGRRHRSRGRGLLSVATQHSNEQNDESGKDTFHVFASPSQTSAKLQISTSMSISGEGMLLESLITPPDRDFGMGRGYLGVTLAGPRSWVCRRFHSPACKPLTSHVIL